MKSLYALKPWYSRRLSGIVTAAVRRDMSPDMFTAAGVLGAGCAAVVIAFGIWPLAIVFLAVRLAGANLDGSVARARGVTRPWGFVLNEIGDRASDLLMFAGLAVWAARQPAGWLSWPVLWVLVAAVAATLPTFASLAAAAAGAGVPRRNGGPFGKTERCLAAVIATALPATLSYVAAVIVAGSLLTAARRLRAARLEL